MTFFSDLSQAVPLVFLWVLHFFLLLCVAKISAGKGFELSVASVFFVFYSVAALFGFEFTFFELRYEYFPGPVALAVYVIADFLFLASIIFLYRGAGEVGGGDGWGGVFLVWLAIFAEIVHVYFNGHLFFLPKAEYIAALSEGVPNLFLITIPAESILAAAIINNPFKNRVVRAFVLFLGWGIVFLSAFLGYRHLVLIVLLILVFKNTSRVGVVSVVLLLTFSGELSNDLKVIFSNILMNDDFDLRAYIGWALNREDRMFISTEQAAIASNFQIGLPLIPFGNDFIETLGLLPFASHFFEGFQSGSERIGSFVGVGYGQGVAYNFHLFLLNTFFCGGVFLFVAMYFLKKFRNTVLLVYGVEVFYSMLRNPPLFWVSQLKLFIFLAIVMFFVDLFKKKWSFSSQYIDIQSAQ